MAQFASVSADRIVEIDQWLPQTQCTLCGYPDCLEYATAIAGGRADINQCPPGGEDTIAALARLLVREMKPLNPAFGEHRRRHGVAIAEDNCIGCTLCIQACPVDAIVGANKYMHTVIIDECTGCDLCIPVCPVDCIHITAPANAANTGNSRWPHYSAAQTERARQRVQARKLRQSRDQRRKVLAEKHALLRGSDQASERIRTELKAAISRARSS